VPGCRRNWLVAAVPHSRCCCAVPLVTTTM
jgi:hypothetical protein